MTQERLPDSVARLLRRLAEALDRYLEGDELAFETLGEIFEQEGFGADDLHLAALFLNGMAGAAASDEAFATVEGAPGRRTTRVWSAEERESLSPEAWGFLLALRERGSLDSEQFERVLGLLTGSGVRRVDVETAREVASRVALDCEPSGPEGSDDGPVEIAH